jgi:soluble cytochrome b562
MFFSFSVPAQETSKLSVTMKNVGLGYKTAMNATTDEQLLSALASMSHYLNEAKKATFKKEVKKQSLEGLQKVLAVIEHAKMLVIRGDLQSAKNELKKIDRLRKEYHKLHEPPSFWQLLFG